jgi:hypothetical protein
MTFQGHVKNGVVLLDGGATLPEGAEVRVELAPPRAAAPAGTPDERGWPPGYFQNSFGSIADETFVRQPQGELPPAVDFD